MYSFIFERIYRNYGMKWYSEKSVSSYYTCDCLYMYVICHCVR